MNRKDDEVVITGAGLVCSLGENIPATWDALLSGKCGIRPIEDFDPGGFKCRMAAPVDALVPSELNIPPRDDRIMDKHSYMLLKCSRDAYFQSNLDKAPFSGEEIGFFAGMGMVDYNVEDLMPAILKSMNTEGSLDFDAFYSQGFQEIHPLWPLSMLNNITFSQVAISLGIQGENAVFTPHSDSGAMAIVEGMKTLEDNKAKVVLAGGVSEKISPSSLARAHVFGILNTQENNNDAMCSPFSVDRNGTILGEGCGILTMELRSSAYKRNVPCLGSITGYGFAFEAEDGFSGPSANAISTAMKKSMDRAEIGPSDVDVIIAHGDGVRKGDQNEIEAIQRVFSGCADRIKVFSSKGALGHLLAGASAVDVILGLNMIKNGIVPSTISFGPIENDIMFHLVHQGPLKVFSRRIMINCQSYEGQCASLLIEAENS